MCYGNKGSSGSYSTSQIRSEKWGVRGELENMVLSQDSSTGYRKNGELGELRRVSLYADARAYAHGAKVKITPLTSLTPLPRPAACGQVATSCPPRAAVRVFERGVYRMPKMTTDLEREPFGIVFRAPRSHGSETKAQAFGRLLEANPALAPLLEANREMCVLVGPVRALSSIDSDLNAPALSGKENRRKC